MTIAEVIRERGPVTVAAFMDLALYHPAFGYYARAAQRSGRTGDFFTSVDVGPLFGELLAAQISEMGRLLDAPASQPPVPSPEPPTPSPQFDFVEVGAGNARLSADILHALQATDQTAFERIRLHLVEASPTARAAQRATLGDELATRLTSSSDTLPDGIEGIVFANELLDAMPVHQVVMRPDGLREVYVTSGGDDPQTSLRLVEGPPSTPELVEYLERVHISLEPGWRVEINLRAVAWMRALAKRLRRGFVIVIDYGHEAAHLYSASHSSGTLTTFARHHMSSPADAQREDQPLWLHAAGDQDITSHVDFTSVRHAGEAEGLTTLGFLDQTYFLMGLLQSEEDLLRSVLDTREHNGASASARGRGAPRELKKPTNALKTLLLPGGLGSTHKVLILGKNVGTPRLAGCSFKMRVT